MSSHPQFPAAPEEWHLESNRIGSGSFGDVRLVRVGGELYAWKEIRETNVGLVRKEVENLELMNRVGCKHFVRFHDCTRRGKCWLRFEYLAGGSLQSHLKMLTVPTACRVALQLVSALSTMRRNDITHGDLKPPNIMLTTTDLRSADIKLIDFLSASAAVTCVGTLIHTKKYSDALIETTPNYPNSARDTYAFAEILDDMFGSNGLDIDGEDEGEVPKGLPQALTELRTNLQTVPLPTRWSVSDIEQSRCFAIMKDVADKAEAQCQREELRHTASVVVAQPHGVSKEPRSLVGVEASQGMLAHYGDHGVKLADLCSGKTVLACRTVHRATAVAVLSKTSLLYADKQGVWYVDVPTDKRDPIRPMLVQRAQNVESLSVTAGARWAAYTTPSGCKVCKIGWCRKDNRQYPLLTAFTMSPRAMVVTEAQDRSLVVGYVDVNGTLQVCSYKAPPEVRCKGGMPRFEFEILERLQQRNEAESRCRQDLDKRREWPTVPAMRGLPQDTVLALSSTGRYAAVYIPASQTVRVFEYNRECAEVSVLQEVVGVTRVTSLAFSPSSDMVERDPEKGVNVTRGAVRLVVVCTQVSWTSWFGSRGAYVYDMGQGVSRCTHCVPAGEGAVAVFAQAEDVAQLMVVGDDGGCFKAQEWNLAEGKTYEKAREVTLLQMRSLPPTEADAGLASSDRFASAKQVNGVLRLGKGSGYKAAALCTKTDIVFVPFDPTRPKVVASLFENSVATRKEGTYAIKVGSKECTAEFTTDAGELPTTASASLKGHEVVDYRVAGGLSASLVDPTNGHLAGIYDLLSVEPEVYPVWE